MSALRVSCSGTRRPATGTIACQPCTSTAAAIAFALEGDPRDYDPSAEAVTLDVNVAPAA
jgi:hypothetical protein